MAPEQLPADAPDARTDVVALGVIAYDLLAGDLPFGRGSLAHVILAQDRGAPALGDATRPFLPRWNAWYLARWSWILAGAPRLLPRSRRTWRGRPVRRPGPAGST